MEKEKTNDNLNPPSLLERGRVSLEDIDVSDSYSSFIDKFTGYRCSCYHQPHFDLSLLTDVEQIKYRQKIIQEGIEDDKTYEFMRRSLHWHPSSAKNENRLEWIRERLRQDRDIVDYISEGIEILSDSSSEGLREVKIFLESAQKRKEMNDLEKLLQEYEKAAEDVPDVVINLERGRYGFYIGSVDVKSKKFEELDYSFNVHSDLMHWRMRNHNGLGVSYYLDYILGKFSKIDGRRVDDAQSVKIHYKGETKPYLELEFEETKGILNRTTERVVVKRNLSDLINTLSEWNDKREIRTAQDVADRLKESDKLRYAEEELVTHPGGINGTRYNALRHYFLKKREKINTSELEWSLRDLSDMLNSYSLAVDYARRLKSKTEVCFPEILPAEENKIKIIEGKSPLLIEDWKLKDEDVVANNYSFSSENNLKLVTGAVAGGKTTYAEGLTLLQFMAQSGLPIPAKSAKISIRDQVHIHKVASGDNYNSRFEFEMKRVNEIFDSTTPHSLIIFDEPCGATSHNEGLEIAKGIIEGVNYMGSPCIYVTHMHELADWAEEKKYGENLHCVYDGEKPTYRIEKGKAGSSHSISLASKYGLDRKSLIERLNKRDSNNWVND